MASRFWQGCRWLMLAVTIISLSGCGGCGTCGPVGCPVPTPESANNISAKIVYVTPPTGDANPVVSSSGTNGTTGDFYFRLDGGDPSAGKPNWKAANWASHFKLAVADARDTDTHIVERPSTDASCDLSPFEWFTQDNMTSHTWTGDVRWEVGNFTLTAKVDDVKTSVEQLRNCISNDDNSIEVSVNVHIWDAIVTGPMTLERGESGSYKCEFLNLPEEYVESINWESSGTSFMPSIFDFAWEGIIVANTLLTCVPVVNLPVVGKIDFAWPSNQPSLRVVITPRSWRMDAPTLREDGLDDWELTDSNENPVHPNLAPISCTIPDHPNDVFGEFYESTSALLVDEVTVGNTRINPHFSLPIDQMLSDDWIKVEEIRDYGPNHGKYWVKDAKVYIKQMSVVNKWLRPNSQFRPGLSPNCWYDEQIEHNCGHILLNGPGIATWYRSLLDHEGWGNHQAYDNDGIIEAEDAFLSSGHFGRMFEAYLDPDNDPKQGLERVVGSSREGLYLDASARLRSFENAYLVAADGGDHVYVRRNWAEVNGGDTNYLTRGWHSFYVNDPNDPNLEGAWGNPLHPDYPCDCLHTGSPYEGP